MVSGASTTAGADGFVFSVSIAFELVTSLTPLKILTLYAPWLAILAFVMIKLVFVAPGNGFPFRNHRYSRGRGSPRASTERAISDPGQIPTVSGCRSIRKGTAPPVFPGEAISPPLPVRQVPPWSKILPEPK